MAARMKHLPFWLLAFAIPACSGGGCSSCSGVTPLPGGFAQQERIENSASVRLTAAGVDFLQQNIGTIASKVVGEGNGTLTFPINRTEGSVSILFFDVNYTICPDGPSVDPLNCTIEIKLDEANLDVSTGEPTDVTVTGTIPIRLQSLPIDTSLGDAEMSLTNNDACQGENQEFAPVAATIRLSVETDTDPAHARFGYSKITIKEVTISKDDIEDAVKLNCGGGFAADVLNFFKGFVVDQAFDSLTGTLVSSVEEQLCQKADPAVGCPTNTFDVDGTCRYENNADAACVSMVLGTDGHAELSGLLASISPGTKGGMNFMLAAGGDGMRTDNPARHWGDLNPVAGGATLGMYGGVEPSPASGCVIPSNLPRPAGIPIPDELMMEYAPPAWPAGSQPHVGIALNEGFFNYALSGLYNSGLFCIGVTTDTIDLLNSGTLGLLAQSLKDLTLHRDPAAIGLMIRPTQAPSVVFGNGTNIETDPHVRLKLNQADFDFYVFSLDRFVRFMTVTFDIEVPINLGVTPEGLVPIIDKVTVSNGKITNNALLRDDPQGIINALQGLISTQVGSALGGGISPIDLGAATESLGLSLMIPESPAEGVGSPGIVTLKKDNQSYLGIFASFAPANMNAISVETSASVEEKVVEIEGLREATLTEENIPEVRVHVADATRRGEISEYQVRVDGGAWKPFRRGPVVSVQDPSFRLEGRHVVEVRGRYVADPMSLDATPERLEVLIDKVAPEPKISQVDGAGQVKLTVFDMVSKEAGTEVRFRLDDGAFGPWQKATELTEIGVGDAGEITVEARDEEGNVGTAVAPLIRGLPRGDGECGCRITDTDERSSTWGAIFAVLGVALFGARARRRFSKGPSVEKECAPPANRKSAASAARRVAQRILIALGVVLVSGSYAGCSCGDESTTPDDDGNYVCALPACVALEPGLIGAYTSVAVSGGDLWVAGYLEGDYNNDHAYGDLVVGKWDGSAVGWNIVDGVPDDVVDDKVYDKNGFRGGQTSEGDDVGLWTSIAVAPDGQPGVAYYDKTNRSLKYAKFNGSAWEIAKVDGKPDWDIGRYAKLIFEGSNAVIAYYAIESVPSGFPKSRVRVARQSGSAFTTEDVVVNAATPCVAETCIGGASCADTGECGAKSSACPEACADGDECVALSTGDTCISPKGASVQNYPQGAGLYISAAKDPSGGIAIAYYDRGNGSLNLAFNQGGWQSVVVEGGDPAAPSDVGIGASLFVDTDGNYHLTYVDGYAEAVKYAQVNKDKTIAGIEVIDDGLSVGGTKFPDGQHLVGDDSFVRVIGGTVHVTYQDATQGRLRYATGTGAAGAHTWTVKVVDSPDQFGGFFSSTVDVSGALKLVHWWRKGGQRTEGNVSVLSPP